MWNLYVNTSIYIYIYVYIYIYILDNPIIIARTLLKKQTHMSIITKHLT